MQKKAETKEIVLMIKSERGREGDAGRHRGRRSNGSRGRQHVFVCVFFFTLAAAVQSVFIRWQLFYSAITGDMKHRTTVIVMRDVLYGDRWWRDWVTEDRISLRLAVTVDLRSLLTWSSSFHSFTHRINPCLVLPDSYLFILLLWFLH